MKLISWNVNGIRAALKKDFMNFVSDANPDILCVQETKAPRGGMEISVPGYHEFWNDAEKPGYSGTLILSKTQPVCVKNHMGVAKHDTEGRVITAEYNDFFLVNVYVPNAKRGLLRLPYREKEWDVDFLKYLKKLEKSKPVVICGDFNVAHKEIDLANPKSNVRTHGFTIEERTGFDNFVKAGFIDTFREFTQEGGHYTWWSPMRNCRANNIGWRIDYFLVSATLKSQVKSSRILPDVMGSDHCPVEITLA